MTDYSKCPWMDFMHAHLGESFHTGMAPTAFNRMVFSHTDFGPLGDNLPAGCAATVSAAVDIMGYQPAQHHAAAALSYAKVGQPCDVIRGAICVIMHLTGDLAGHFHVAFIEEAEVIAPSGAKLIKLIGGNQDHELCIKAFDLSQHKIVATRWPDLKPVKAAA